MSVLDPILEKLHWRLTTIRNTRVGDIMNRKVITLDVNDLLATAARTLVEHRINGIVVLKEGKPYAVLTSWELLHQSYLESFSDKMDYLRTPLEQLIESPNLHSLKPTDSLDSAAKLITLHSQRTVPVIENDELVGVISKTDLIKAYHKLLLETDS